MAFFFYGLGFALRTGDLAAPVFLGMIGCSLFWKTAIGFFAA
jgi:hypothetical protein